MFLHLIVSTHQDYSCNMFLHEDKKLIYTFLTSLNFKLIDVTCFLRMDTNYAIRNKIFSNKNLMIIDILATRNNILVTIFYYCY